MNREVVSRATHVEEAMADVPVPNPRMIRPHTNIGAFCAAVMSRMPIALITTAMTMPVLRPTWLTTGPMDKAAMPHPMKLAAVCNDFVAVVRWSVSLYEGMIFMPFLAQ